MLSKRPGSWSLEMVSASSLILPGIWTAEIVKLKSIARLPSSCRRNRHVMFLAEPLFIMPCVPVLSVWTMMWWSCHLYHQRWAARTIAASSLVLMWWDISFGQSLAHCEYSQSPWQNTPPAKGHASLYSSSVVCEGQMQRRLIPVLSHVAHQVRSHWMGTKSPLCPGSLMWIWESIQI